ncbi:MAG: HEAT repeat domain-containing protein [Planctomycetes bacterium]|nr:HEAT repeat domain-containing protein [Planctomycetota bacterium]
MKAALLALLLMCPQDPASLIERWRDDSPRVRDEATRTLRAMDDAALPALRTALNDRDPEMRARARSLIDRIEWDAAMDPGLLARYEGLRLAFETGDHPRVIEIATKRNHGIRGYRGDFEAYGIKLLDHPDVNLKREGLGLLGASWGVSRRPIAALLRQIARWDPVSWQDQGSSWLGAFGGKVYELGSPLDRDLLAATHSEHAEAEGILKVLRARHGVADAETELPKLVASELRQVSWLALRCVRDLACKAARPQVLRRLQEPDLLSTVAEVAVAIEDDACRAAYIELWRSTPPEKRTYSHVRLLARSGAPETVPTLLELVETGPRPMAYEAAFGLAALRVHEAIDLLLSPAAAADLRSDFLRCAARIVDARDVGKLAEQLVSSSESLRNDARWLLITNSDKDARARLVELLVAEKRPEIRDRLFDVVKCCQEDPALIESVPDKTLESILREGEINAACNAADLLLKRKGAAAPPIIEETILAIGEPRALLLHKIADHPSERLARAAAEWLEGEFAAYAVIPYLEKAGSPEARAALERAAKALKNENARAVAVAAAARLRGDPPPKDLMEDWIDRDSWFRHVDPVTTDAPGAREEIRKKFKEGWAGSYVKALRSWAHPEMIPKLMEGLRRWDEGLAERVQREGVPGSCLISGDEVYGGDWMVALRATDDRSLAPFFVERLADPDDWVRHVAVETAGRWRLKEAAPTLRRLVRSGDFSVRADALLALAKIGEPGTKEFIIQHLRDNPHAAPYALARLGAKEACPEIARLLDDPSPHAPVLGALDLLTHSEVYARVDRLLPPRRSGEPRLASTVIEELLGSPVRITGSCIPELHLSADNTLRGALEGYTGMNRDFYTPYDKMPTFVFRNGAVEFCSADEARAVWKARR